MKQIYQTNLGLIKAIALSFILFISCSKGSDKSSQPKEKKTYVYIAGYETIGAKEVATLWENGTPKRLTDGKKNAYAYSVYVDGKDVYVAGERGNANGHYEAVLWKNGQATTLSQSADDWGALTIFKSGSDVYVGGYKIIGYQSQAIVWKNGKIFYQFPVGKIGKITHMFVQGNNVYITGSNNGYWKLTSTSQEFVATPDMFDPTDLALSEKDLYLSGNDNKIVKYTKNGKAVNLTDGALKAQSSAMFVAGADVYVVGGGEKTAGSNYMAKLWKNGTLTNLTDGTRPAYASSIFVCNDKVYVIGYDDVNGSGSGGCLWEDGKPTRLVEKGTLSSIFVVYQ